MKRKGSAIWQGGLKDGHGTVSTESGILSKTQYSFSSRFEHGAGTNPEELLAAAHAGCFSMQLSAFLGEAGLTAESIETSAAVTVDKVEGGFGITLVHLEVKARIPGTDNETFVQHATKAKESCPVSKLFNTKITMDAALVG